MQKKQKKRRKKQKERERKDGNGRYGTRKKYDKDEEEEDMLGEIEIATDCACGRNRAAQEEANQTGWERERERDPREKNAHTVD